MIDMCFAFLKTKENSVDEVCNNLEKLLCSCSSYRDLEELAGKRIKHKWKDEDDEKWYYGTILDLVPGTKDWYNIKYDGEEEVLSLNILMDIEKGDLLIISRIIVKGVVYKLFIVIYDYKLFFCECFMIIPLFL